MFDEAERTATQMRQSTEAFPDLTIDDAYVIQAEWQKLKIARGEKLVGHKIGLTSRAMQAAMNIDTPDSGFLTDKMVFEPDSQLAAADFCDPKLEVELAFVLAHDLAGADLSVDDVLDASSGLELQEMVLDDDTSIPSHCTILAVIRDDERLIGQAAKTPRSGDRVVVLIEPDSAR